MVEAGLSLFHHPTQFAADVAKPILDAVGLLLGDRGLDFRPHPIAVFGVGEVLQGAIAILNEGFGSVTGEMFDRLAGKQQRPFPIAQTAIDHAGNISHHGAEALVVVSQGGVGLFLGQAQHAPLGDVLGNGVDQVLGPIPKEIPAKPTIGSVFASVAIFQNAGGSSLG